MMDKTYSVKNLSFSIYNFYAQMLFLSKVRDNKILLKSPFKLLVNLCL